MPSRPAPLDQLIGAPLRSLVMGQGIAASASTELMADLGLVGQEDGSVVARTVEFTYVHPVPDPANPGATVDTPTRISAPLLSLLSIPHVAIEEATVAFRANVVDVRSTFSGSDPKDPKDPKLANVVGVSADMFPRTLRLTAAYAPSRPVRNEAALSFSIRVVREPAPEGLSTILNLLSEAVRAEPVKPLGDPMEQK